jgi:pyrimidine operon attenuation protein/uracil phosphoribosyltransferase
MRTYYDQNDVRRLIEQLGAKVAAAFRPDQPLNIIGMLTRGETVAQRLTSILEAQGYQHIQRGVLDITFYRDDLTSRGPAALARPSQIDIPLDDIPLLLVDDVLYTGRSTRAALNALVDFGRPSVIRLAALVEREGRELPIQADFVGLKVTDMPPDHRVNVRLQEDDGKDEIVVEPQA